MKFSKLEKKIDQLRINDVKNVDVTSYQKIYLDVMEALLQKWKETYERGEISQSEFEKLIQDTRKYFIREWAEIDKLLSC